MTQTIQFYSPIVVNEKSGADNIHKPEVENMRLLALLIDDLNNLCEELSRLDHVIRRNREQIVYWKNKDGLK